MAATINLAWPHWPWRRKGSPPARKRTPLSRPTEPRRYCPRTTPLTIAPSRYSAKRRRSRIPNNSDRPFLYEAGVSDAMSPPVRTVILALAGALVSAAVSAAQAATDLAPAQREAIEGIIHDYLLHNPDVLLEAIRGAEEKLNHEADVKAAKVLNDRQSEIFDDH